MLIGVDYARLNLTEMIDMNDVLFIDKESFGR